VRLLRYGPRGQERPGLLDQDGVLRDLASEIDDIGANELSPAGLERLRLIDHASLPAVDGKPRLGIPFTGTRKFIGIGLNFADHAAESNLPIPAEPVIFTKAVSCLQGPDDPILIPRGSKKTDWEVELGVVIGSRTSYVSEDAALSHVAGYVVVNDVSEREFQIERGGTWDKGKGCDTFGPVGPWLVTPDELPGTDALDMWLDVNGVRRQTGNTRSMIFKVAELVSYVSRFMTLEPGDIITTGTPPGVGMGLNPPIFLRGGDVITLGISGLGQQRQDVVAFEASDEGQGS